MSARSIAPTIVPDWVARKYRGYSSMNSNSKLSYAIAAILSTSSPALSYAAAATDTAAPASQSNNYPDC